MFYGKKQQLLSMLYLVIVLISFSACVSKSKVTYLQGADAYSVPTQLPTTYEITIQPDDQLSISVSSSEKELLEPFSNKISIGTGNASGGGGGANGRAHGGAWFTVDKEGYIEFPVFGLIKVSGYSRKELARMIENKLKSGGYTQDPVVSVEIMSFKVTVLSDGNNSVVTCPTERFTILEAIAEAGGIQLTGKRQNVLVLREQEGKVQSFRVDLSNAKSTLNSPVYYLKQNDVIYIEPNGATRVQASPFYKYATAFSSVAGIITTIVGLALIWKKFE